MGTLSIVRRGFRQTGSSVLRPHNKGALRAARLAIRPSVMALEKRLTLTGGVAITSASVVSANHQPLTAVAPGQTIQIQVDLTTRGLPKGALYIVNYTVNGLSRASRILNLGSGLAGTRTWSLDSKSFPASGGTNMVMVSIVPFRNMPTTDYPASIRRFRFSATATQVTGDVLSYTVSQIRAAYGINQIPRFGSAPADGAGQTIAVVDACNDPTIIQGLNRFDRAMHLSTNWSPTLYQRYGPASSILTVYNQYGKNITAAIAHSGDARNGVPAVDPTNVWEDEETIDVEWAHAIAPAAKIDLIECTGSGEFEGLFSGAALARGLPGVSVVSMSWQLPETEVTASGEQAYDSTTFVTPRHHRGVTFLASAGDNGGTSGYPAMSPHVVAVGATDLKVDGDTYVGETAWSYPKPSAVLDEKSKSLSHSGSWTSHAGGYSGTYWTAPARSKSSATWTTTISSADLGHEHYVELSATWLPGAANATNATYRIYVRDPKAASAKLIGTYTVNQTQAPVGTLVGNAHFQYLGDYQLQSNDKLTVVLSADPANGKVVADAVGITRAYATAGGQSKYEPEPSYQRPFQDTGHRTSPDVVFNGSRSSCVTTCRAGTPDFAGGYGTSLASPCWAGLIAIANQGRLARGGKTFNSPSNPTQTLQALYSLPASDFHEITEGYNGLFPGAGYNEVSGRGSPIANRLIPALARYGLNARRPPLLTWVAQIVAIFF